MKIEGAKALQYLRDIDRTQGVKGDKLGVKTENHAVSDKIEISEEAKLLRSQGVTTKDFEAIRAKISSGEYNTDEVLGEVADNILKEIR